MKTKLLTTIFMATACILPAVSFAQFATLWTQTINPSTLYDNIFAITADTSGIYLVGYETVNQNILQWRIEKRNLSTGTLIWTQTSTSDTANIACAITADTSGIYVVGSNNHRSRIEKRNLSTGALIWAQTFILSAAPDYAYGITADASGIYVAGNEIDTLFPDYSRWHIEKRDLTTGIIIWTQNYNAIATAITADTSGIYVAGADSGDIWRIEKRNLNTGTLIWSKTSSSAWAQAITADASGIYIAGVEASNLNASGYLWRMEKRNLIAGTLIWTQTSNIYPSWGIWNRILAITADASGIYGAGTEYDTVSGDFKWRVEKRNLNTGDLICVHTRDSSVAQGITGDTSGIYVVGADWLEEQWRIEKYDGICLPLTIESLENKKKTSIYPNPFSTQTTLQITENLKGATLTVYNSFGQQVKQIKNISGHTVTLHRDNLPNGLYFLRLTEDSKVITTDKLVIAD